MKAIELFFHAVLLIFVSSMQYEFAPPSWSLNTKYHYLPCKVVAEDQE